MTSAATQQKTSYWQLLVFAFFALSTTMYLFYLDEGYFDFSWMNNVVNWVFYFIYSMLLFSGQLFLFYVILKHMPAVIRWHISVPFGMAIGLGIAFIIF